MSIGLRIKELREELGISQKELAEELNISRPSITKYERDEREPSYMVLLKISDFFGVSSDYLLGKTNEKDKNSYSYNKNIKRIENIDAHSFAFSDTVLSTNQESAINGLLAHYLSIIQPDNPISLDCLYLSSVLIEAIERYYCFVFGTLYETDDNTNFHRKDIDSQTLVDMQNAQKTLATIFAETLDRIEKFALSDIDGCDSSPAYFINEILEEFSTKKGKEFVIGREAIYELFKVSKNQSKNE